MRLRCGGLESRILAAFAPGISHKKHGPIALTEPGTAAGRDPFSGDGDELSWQNAHVSGEDADTIRRLPDELSKPTFAQNQQKNFISLLGIRAVSDVNYARALGPYAAA